MGKYINTLAFIEKANKVHNFKYDYSKVNYIKNSIKVSIICPIHGEFLQRPAGHLSGQTCFKCRKPPLPPFTTKEFIEKATKIHDSLYDYSLVEYTTMRKKVKIICPVHGVFEQKPISHIHSKAGCKKCNNTGWSKTKWINLSNKKNNLPILYIIRCFNKSENFIKIGKTSDKIYDRFNRSKIPYSYEVIKEIKDSAEFIWDKEIELHKKFKDYKYKPILKFPGYTECFTLEVLDILYENF